MQVGKRFLLAVWEGGGTLPPEMEIARKLIERGHCVRVIGAELDRNPADMVLADAVMIGALIAAESRGLPRAALVPNIYMCPAPGIPPIGVGFAQAHGPLGRIRDRVIGAMMDRMWRRGLPAINAARASLGLATVRTIREQKTSWMPCSF